MTVRKLLIAVALLLPTPAHGANFDRALWKADFQRLKVALAQGYANLDWQVEKRRLNLAGADGAINSMLDGVDSDVGATLVMVKLLEAFDDPHLELKAGPPPQGATLLPRASSVAGVEAAANVCAAESYAAAKPATRLPYPQAPGWKPVSDGPFLAGTIGDIGVIRIPQFGESRYLDACKAVARKGLAGRDLQLAVRAELNRQIAATIGKLKAAGARRLIVDLSRNGGGSEWSTEAVTLFTKGRLTRNEPRRAGPSCDRTNIWKGEKPACSIYAGAQTVEWVEADRPPPWTGPLAVIVDHDTASAAEEFAAWLQDNDRAKVGGVKTYGAGCGYIDGGSAFAFKAAPMHLMIPNCSRIRRDGTNEIEAVTPDVTIDWQKLTPDAVAAAFAKLF